MFNDDWEAQEYLDSLTTPATSSLIRTPIDDDYILSQNARIIRAADEFLLERLENGDSSLRTTDVISAKDMAFKQNAKIMGLGEDDNKQLIPSQINIQIINN